MFFRLYPIIDTMLDLYTKPRSMERFQDYLKILQGDSKDDMLVPISNFNPMAKEHVSEKLLELKVLKAEELMLETIWEINKITQTSKERTVNVSLALADDLKGAWTNRFTTDYDSKFKLNALIARNFCTPLFWSGEEYNAELIKQRTLQSCLRTQYWANKPKPQTLEDHIQQEIFVAQKSEKDENVTCDFNHLKAYFDLNKTSEQYDVIFNFLYGDAACKELEFPVHGIKDAYAGYSFAKRMAFRK